MYVFKKYMFLLKNTGLWASKYRFVFPEVGMSGLPIDTCLVSKKFCKSPVTNYDFGVAIGGLLLKLQNFKKVKLIFGHPVFPYCLQSVF